MSETYTCPECKHRHTFDDVHEYTDTETEMECDNCGAGFMLSVETDIVYRIDEICLPGNHEWGEASKKYPDYKFCNKCGFLSDSKEREAMK